MRLIQTVDNSYFSLHYTTPTLTTTNSISYSIHRALEERKPPIKHTRYFHLKKALLNIPNTSAAVAAECELSSPSEPDSVSIEGMSFSHPSTKKY